MRIPAVVGICGVLVSGCAANRTSTGTGDATCCREETAKSSASLVTPWLAAGERVAAVPANFRWRDDKGCSGTFADLRGRPMALSFIYTRCTNPNKCARVTRAMAELQEEVETAGLSNRVLLLLLTYDPEHDTPAVLSQYAKARGVKADSGLRLARMDSAENRKLLDELEAAVNFNGSGVNIHGIQLFLFDKQGRCVRTYKTLLWDNGAVLRDLKRLASETP